MVDFTFTFSYAFYWLQCFHTIRCASEGHPAYKENSAPTISKSSALAVFVRRGLTWNNLHKGKLIKQKIAAAEAAAIVVNYGVVFSAAETCFFSSGQSLLFFEIISFV